MTEFFPRSSVAWTLEQPAAVRRMVLSLPQMALITGVCLRLWRSYTYTHGAPTYLWVGGTFLIGVTFLFLMLTLHLGHFTLRHWLWRAPLFALLESGTEVVMALALTTVGLEPLGSEKAEMSDWIPMATRNVFLRLTGIILFSLVLAFVVSIIRRILLGIDNRTSTAVAIRRASLQHEGIPPSEPHP